MSGYEAALELADKLIAAGVVAVCDPRAASPPCVLFTPPSIDFDHGCEATGNWNAYALVPGPANADAWQALDALVAAVYAVVPLEHADFVSYTVAVDAPPVPAYQLRYVKGFEL